MGMCIDQARNSKALLTVDHKVNRRICRNRSYGNNAIAFNQNRFITANTARLVQIQNQAARFDQ